MRSLINKLLTALAITVCATASAQPTQVELVWAFSHAAPPINYTRQVMSTANDMQSKYNFVLNIKPGAAGSIAAKHALTQVEKKQLALLVTSTAFFVKPHLFNDAGYKFDEFRLAVMQTEIPMALVAKKGRSLDEILNSPKISIGIAGLGSVSHIQLEQIRRGHENKAVMVPYNGSREAVKDVIGGDLDMTLDTVASVINDPKLEIIGVTGTRSVAGLKRLIDLDPKYQNLAKLDLTMFMLAPAGINEDVVRELNEILIRAQSQSTGFKTTINSDYGSTVNIPYKNNKAIYDEQIALQKKLTAGMPKLD